MRLRTGPVSWRKPIKIAIPRQKKPKLDGTQVRGAGAGKLKIASLERALQDAERRLGTMTRLAYVDSLSGLGNRRAFEDEMRRTQDRAARYGFPAAVAIFDVDAFKAINDVHGHEAGDVVIVAIGSSLRSQIRASDFVARIGGDEFAVILNNIEFEDALSRIEAMRASVAALDVVLNGAHLSVSTSVGVSAIHSSRPTDPLREADQAMYRQKKAAKSIFTFA
jgi:diguanylate cyclase (GGDEF)-like protein